MNANVKTSKGGKGDTKPEKKKKIEKGEGKIRKSSKGKKEKHSHEINPKEDLKLVDYTTECDVTVITPLIFGDPEDQPGAKEEKKKKKKDKKKEERKKPDDVVDTDEKRVGKGEGKKGEKVNKAGKGDSKGEGKKGEKVNKAGKGDNKGEGKKGEKEDGQKKADFKGIPIIQMSLGSKKGHPWESQIEGAMALVANRVPGGPLTLSRDKKYIFRFIGKIGAGYELIFTRDPVGGKKASILDGTGPIPIGEERILVLGEGCPSMIFYQERNRNCFGGVINVTE